MSRTVTATEKLRAVNEGKMARAEFVRQMRQLYPMYVTQFNGFEDSVSILKRNKILFEGKEDIYDAPSYAFSDETLRRGIDYELEAMGIDSAGSVSKEDQEKAKDKAVKNLNKNSLHYLHLLSGDSNKVDKHDKPVEYKKGKEVDTFNGLKKAELKENTGVVSTDDEGKAEKLAKKGINVKLSEADPIPTSPGVPGEKASNSERKLAMRQIIDFLTLDGHPETGYKVSTQDAIDFIKTHKDEIFSGEIDYKDFNDVWHNYDEYETINRDIPEVMGVDRKGNQKPETAPSRFKGRDKSVSRAVATEALSDEDMKAIEKYGHSDKPVKAYRPGDMFSSDFDYEGMLEAGLKIRLNTPIQTLQAIYDSFEDVNYHRENRHLGNAIDAIKDNDKSEALDHIRNFKKEVKQTLLSLNEGETPIRELEEGDPMTMAYTKKVKDINERVGSLDEFISLIEDRAANNDTMPQDEAIEVMEALIEELDIPVRLVHDVAEDQLEEEPNEGNKFEEERLKAIKAGKKEFSVDGKTFPVKGADAEDKKRAKMVKENVKAIVQKILSEEVLLEAATNNLSDWGEGYAGFDGVKPVVNELENIVTEIEAFYDKISDKIANAMAKSKDFRNLDGMKVGAFIAPSLEAAFKKDLRPVQKLGFLNKIELPKVRTITQADIDAHNSGERPLGEEDKQTVYTPVNEKKK